jgi:cobalamin biosynthesis Mg chelatase CobN
MKNITPLFPGFHLQTLRKTPRSAMQIMADKMVEIKQKTFWQLGVCFGDYIPSHYLAQSESGTNSRRRLLSKENTFWSFLSQVLDADGGCKEVVRKLQVFSAMKSMKQPSSSTSAYCQARKNLDTSSVENILQYTSNSLKFEADPKDLNGRRVVVVDGTGVSVPDTIENQKVWPQQSSQKIGCGFPQASI